VGILKLASKLEAVVLTPLLHDLDEVLYLWVGRVLEHVDHFNQAFFVLSAGNH